MEKLRWLNGVWIRVDLGGRRITQRLIDWAFNREMLMQVLPHARKRIETLSDFAPLTAFLVSGTLPITAEDFEAVKAAREDQLRYMQFALWRLEALRHWNRDEVWQALKGLADAMGVKIRDFLAPLFVAIAGTTASFSVVDAMGILGPDMSRNRIRHAIEVLGGVSKKAQKRLDKEYRSVAGAPEQ